MPPRNPFGDAFGGSFRPFQDFSGGFTHPFEEFIKGRQEFKEQRQQYEQSRRAWQKADVKTPRQNSMMEAAEFIARYSRMPKDAILHRGQLNHAYRMAAAVLHPDNKETGDHEGFVKLQKMKGILEGLK